MASARGKKTKKVVDTRASKGRKIRCVSSPLLSLVFFPLTNSRHRYHVHEKAQNFMIPIDAGGWHEEQTDELFSSLLGRTFPKVIDEGSKEIGDEENPGKDVEVGSLRIFG